MSLHPHIKEACNDAQLSARERSLVLRAFHTRNLSRRSDFRIRRFKLHDLKRLGEDRDSKGRFVGGVYVGANVFQLGVFFNKHSSRIRVERYASF